MLVLLNVIVGYLLTSRKFDERMSLSLIPLLVRMLAVRDGRLDRGRFRVVGVDLGLSWLTSSK